MTLTTRDRRALTLLGTSLLVAAIYYFGFPSGQPKAVAATGNGTAMALQRLARVRRVAATLPSAEAVLKQAKTDLELREHGVIAADTAAQGQASLLEIARRVGKEEQLDVRSGEFGSPTVFGEYGMVLATVSFDGRVEQIVNFLADLSRIPELVVPLDEQIAMVNAKDKVMSVRIVLAGVVAKKLIPEKRGLGSF